MSEFLVIAEWTAAPGNEEAVLGLLGQIEDATRQEAGCLSFEGFVSRSDPRRITLVERYRDREAFAAHRGSAHFDEIVQRQVVPLLEERTVRAHAAVEL